MEHIIQQVVVKTVGKIFARYSERGLYNLDEMAEDLKKDSEQMSKELLKAFIENGDKAIVEAKKERKEEGIAIQERDVERNIYTPLGSLQFKRTYFSKKDGGYVSLMDEVLGIEKYERVGSGVSASMVNMAAGMSYGKSADIITGGEISRQTTWNKMMELGEVATLPRRKKTTPEALHIFADEAHPHMQEGRGTIVPLVTICEGKEEYKGRQRLKDPMHIQGYGFSTETHWEYVYAICEEKYDMSKVKRIYLYGDGAGWVVKGLEYFTKAIHILDMYHINKRLKMFYAGDICSVYASEVCKAIMNNNRKRFTELFNKMKIAVKSNMKGPQLKKRLKRLNEDGRYILRFWDAIQNNNLPESIGSCTEALVSHVLAERISRNPMGWTKAGLSKISMVRVFRLNGGKVTALDVGAGKTKKSEPRAEVKSIKKYENIVKKQQKEVLAGINVEGWFSNDEMISAKRTGTRVILDALGKMQNVS